MSEEQFGGFDMNALLQQAQQMQQQMVAAQEELAAAEVEGSVGGGLVTVTVNGTGELLKVKIKPDTIDTLDAGDPSDLEDMILAAYRDARTQAEALAGETFGPLASGLGPLGGGDTGGNILGT